MDTLGPYGSAKGKAGKELLKLATSVEEYEKVHYPFPMLEIGAKVFSLDTKEVGTIRKIDNRCSKVYNKIYENPYYHEYYIKWPRANWSRHYIHEIDEGLNKEIVPYTKAIKVLYGKKSRKKT